MHLQQQRSILSKSRNAIQLQQRSMSFKVCVGAIKPPKSPIAQNQRAQQTWGISGNETLQKLRVATPGLTYVSVAPSPFFDEVAQAQGTRSDQLVAVARVSSDSQDLLERIDVLARGSDRLLIGFNPRPPHGWPIEEPTEPGKHLLTEIFVREASELRSLAAFGGGTLVVTGDEGGSVLENDRPYGKIKMAALRSSRVYVTQQQGIRVGTVSMLASRSGQLYLSVPEFVANDRIRAATAGRWGSSIVVQASKLFTPSFGAVVSGSGSIRLASLSDEDDCHCETQWLAIAGNGSIDTGDIASRTARVAILGSGSATLQTTDWLTLGTLGSARVSSLEPGPAHVRGNPSSLRVLTAAAKAQHDEERTTIAATMTPPTRESAFDNNASNLSRWWWTPWGISHAHRFL
ncbi:unnamed protein product [Phytophthora fragariaefolia]|uniref:Unnamed protein product n=1 Tax=Phytophthora fragariaefolia TaxID=1490495 RepID=A0A9W6Y7S1_9STRA|nr:unnamed protein product [Phytophthora fragariaefolia]